MGQDGCRVTKLAKKALAQVRRAKTLASSQYGLGGRRKERYAPKAITLRRAEYEKARATP